MRLLVVDSILRPCPRQPLSSGSLSIVTRSIVRYKPPNGLRYLRLEGRGLAHKTDKTQSQEESHFGGVNPAVRVQTLLARAYV